MLQLFLFLGFLFDFDRFDVAVLDMQRCLVTILSRSVTKLMYITVLLDDVVITGKYSVFLCQTILCDYLLSGCQ